MQQAGVPLPGHRGEKGQGSHQHRESSSSPPASSPQPCSEWGQGQTLLVHLAVPAPRETSALYSWSCLAVWVLNKEDRAVY